MLSETLEPYFVNANDYQIIDEIERDIYKVQDKKNPSKIYVKKVLRLKGDDKLYIRFIREVELLIKSKLEGFPFAKFCGCNYLQNDETFILTEYLPGNSLKQLIEDKYAKAADQSKYDTEKMIILYGSIFGLNYLHKRSIIHRDIKPANIFLDKKLRPYIGDFGFSRIIKNDLKMTGDTGSLFYMAPEILYEDEVDADFSIDSYSFAVTLLYTLTGSLSLVDQNGEKKDVNLIKEEDFINLIQDGQRYTEIDLVPDDFKECIKDCWDDDPKKRWPVEKIMNFMEEKKLFLKNCDNDKFFSYVNELKMALEKHNRKEEEEDKDEEEEEEMKEETKQFDFI